GSQPVRLFDLVPDGVVLGPVGRASVGRRSLNPMSKPEFLKLNDEQVRARKRRNVAIALGLLAFIALVYTVTVSRMHANNQARHEAEAAALATLERADPALPAPVQPDAPAPATQEP